MSIQYLFSPNNKNLYCNTIKTINANVDQLNLGNINFVPGAVANFEYATVENIEFPPTQLDGKLGYNTYFVTPVGSLVNNGLSWETAVTSIDLAINIIVGLGTNEFYTIYIASGVYRNPISLAGNINLIGIGQVIITNSAIIDLNNTWSTGQTSLIQNITFDNTTTLNFQLNDQSQTLNIQDCNINGTLNLGSTNYNFLNTVFYGNVNIGSVGNNLQVVAYFYNCVNVNGTLTVTYNSLPEDLPITVALYSSNQLNISLVTSDYDIGIYLYYDAASLPNFDFSTTGGGRVNLTPLDDCNALAYNPSTPSNWPSPNPTVLQQAIDILASNYSSNIVQYSLWTPTFNTQSSTISSITFPQGVGSYIATNNGTHPGICSFSIPMHVTTTGTNAVASFSMTLPVGAAGVLTYGSGTLVGNDSVYNQPISGGYGKPDLYNTSMTFTFTFTVAANYFIVCSGQYQIP